jgi:hypothetical protein
MSGQPRFRTGTTFTILEVTSEPYLVLTFRGYTGAIEVLELATGSRYELLIGGIKSLAECLEPLRASNNGAFKGLRFSIRKESEDRFSPYVVAPAESIVSPTANETTEDKLWDRITGTYHK